MEQGAALNKTWPYVVDALIKCVLTDNVFDGVIRAKQGEDEDEAVLSQRLTESVSKARDVFSSEKLVNHYLYGLKDEVHKRVNPQLHTIPDN